MVGSSHIGYDGAMTTLRASTIATIAATFLAFGSPQGAFDDGRGNWDGYAWQTIAIKDCTAVETTLTCPTYRQKWDWKRDQWVTLELTFDLSSNTLHLSQKLTDDDSYDDDFVCVTALVVDASGHDIVAHHQNWEALHGTSIKDDFSYTSPRLAEAVNIYVGSKQCRDGAGQDDKVYAQVLAGIGN